jgi:DNA-binding NtrC family response regulator
MHHILLVDDDEAFRDPAAQALRAAGFGVFPAHDHRRALELLEGTQPLDLLITDIVMPDHVNGLALARMAMLRRHGLKVLYISGYDLPDLGDEALGRVLRKPLDLDMLVDEARRAIGP